MNRNRVTGPIAALLLLAAACGDDAGIATTATVADPTTVATTTSAPTTATTTTTTLPGDLHPVWGVSWEAVWQGREEMAAVYRAQIMGSDWMELAARFEFGVPWRGGTWDRLVIGTVEPGEWGAALYFARPEPWVLRLWGVEQTSPDREDAVLEYFDVPQDLDFTLLPGAPPALEGNMRVEWGADTGEPVLAVYAMEWVGVEDVTVPAGTFEGAFHVRFGLGGDFYPAGEGGEITFFSDLWLHPNEFIVNWEPGPAGGPLELATPWLIPGGS